MHGVFDETAATATLYVLVGTRTLALTLTTP